MPDDDSPSDEAADSPADETADADSPPDEAAGNPANEALLAELTPLLGDALVESANQPNDHLWLRVDAARWRESVQALSDAGFTYFGFLSAVDWTDAPEGRYEDTEFDDAETATEAAAGSEAAAGFERVAGGSTRFQLLLQLHSPERRLGVIVKADLADPDGAADPPAADPAAASPAVESIRDVFWGADWHEREAHEMFGIDFVGHPNLEHIYLPTEFEGHPLRKDFPLLARQVKPWPGVVDIEEIPEHLQAQLEAEVMAEFEAGIAAGEVE